MLSIIKRLIKKKGVVVCLSMIVVAVIGCLLPEHLNIPVQRATPSDWNHHTFWHPWGKSRVHKGIDIFATEGAPVLAACDGIVVYQGNIADGGNVVLILSPQWRFHYYGHLKSIQVHAGMFVSAAQKIGTVGASGNAIGKPPHLHYAIVRLLPNIFRFRWDRHGIDRMFYLNPHKELLR